MTQLINPSITQPREHNDAQQITHKVPIGDVERLALLVASGEMPLPIHLPPDAVHELATRVREIRRRRLVQYIARTIARDLVQSRNAEGKEPD